MAAAFSEGGRRQPTLLQGGDNSLGTVLRRLSGRLQGPAPGSWRRPPGPCQRGPGARGVAGRGGRGRPAIRMALISGSRSETVSRTGFPGWGRGGCLANHPLIPKPRH